MLERALRPGRQDCREFLDKVTEDIMLERALRLATATAQGGPTYKLQRTSCSRGHCDIGGGYNGAWYSIVTEDIMLERALRRIWGDQEMSSIVSYRGHHAREGIATSILGDVSILCCELQRTSCSRGH